MTFAEIIPGLLQGRKYSWEPDLWHVFLERKKLHILHAGNNCNRLGGSEMRLRDALLALRDEGVTVIRNDKITIQRTNHGDGYWVQEGGIGYHLPLDGWVPEGENEKAGTCATCEYWHPLNIAKWEGTCAVWSTATTTRHTGREQKCTSYLCRHTPHEAWRYRKGSEGFGLDSLGGLK